MSDHAAIDARLHLLDTLVGSPDQGKLSVCARTTMLNDSFNQLMKGNPIISAFLRLYECNAESLGPNPANEWDCMDFGDQREIVLSAADDLIELYNNLREIKTLDDAGVLNAGNLADHQALEPDLKIVQKTLAVQTREFAVVEQGVIEHLSAFNTQVDKMSEIFVLLNTQMSAIEHGISRLEREMDTTY